MIIEQAFSLTPVANIMLPVGKTYKESDYKLANPELIVGLELEIEGWNDDDDKTFRGFRFEADGSLRNNGTEAITLPVRSKHVPHLLESFYKKFGITGENYSDRCSTHVHANCQDLTVDEVRTLCALYQVVERVLFLFIGDVRENNIFCVPWNQCNISNGFVRKFMRDPAYTTRNWQKYTALNIIPLRSYGTVEFRHLEGTCDVKRIINWLNLIGSMFAYIKRVGYKDFKSVIANMNTISNYNVFTEDVFGEYADLLTTHPDFQEALSAGVIDAKLCMINDDTAVNNTVIRAAPQPVFGAAPRMPEVPEPTMQELLQALREFRRPEAPQTVEPVRRPMADMFGFTEPPGFEDNDDEVITNA